MKFNISDISKRYKPLKEEISNALFSLSTIDVKDEDKATLINELKKHYFPDSHFCGPFEKRGLVQSMLREQWLWAYRYLIKGIVLDMSTPQYWHQYIYDLHTVDKVLISDLSESVVKKFEHESSVDVIGDFACDSPPVGKESIDTILCVSVLEHCTNPFLMVKNFYDILKQDGYLFIYCPFAYISGHMYPDYWRFCRDGYKLLAEQAQFDVVATGEYMDLGLFYLLLTGVNLKATNWHQGVPVSNWMICKKSTKCKTE